VATWRPVSATCLLLLLLLLPTAVVVVVLNENGDFDHFWARLTAPRHY
jgi:hypothetical protein